MNVPDPYCRAEAFLKDDGQIDWMGDGVSASSSPC